MKARSFIIFGFILILLGGGLTAYNIFQDSYASNISSEVKKEIEKQVIKNEEIWQEIINDVELKEMPTIKVDGNYYVGTIEILALNISLPVMETLTRKNLTISPCLYYGNVYEGNMIIAAHNYRSHFSRLNQLNAEDKIIFTDVDGNEYLYEVVGFEVLTPYDVDEMKQSSYDLTLFTCTYRGEARFTVRCIRVEI